MNARRILIVATFPVLSWAIAFGSVWARAQPSPRDDVAEKVSKDVRHILNTMKSSKYSHKTRVDENQGKYDLDCSGLACYVLQHKFPKHYSAIPLPKGRARPHAVDFYRFFAALPAAPPGRNGWQRISKLLEAEPGDIIAWESDNPKPGGSTGHVLFVDSVPVRVKDNEVKVEIIDSTGHGHGNDTRKAGQTGVGRGTMWFVIDDKGHVTGYHWSSSHGTPRQKTIAIGRLVKIGTAATSLTPAEPVGFCLKNQNGQATMQQLYYNP